ncbi:hypothetical protein C0992_001643 [Termitomyces sp. T32_za158]|nr:hypothetical protein C0992_001643 [Termitomyces sp. T32_za158]
MDHGGNKYKGLITSSSSRCGNCAHNCFTGSQCDNPRRLSSTPTKRLHSPVSTPVNQVHALQRLSDRRRYRLSGFMTARFLLHIRKWEAKHSAIRLSTDNDDGTRTATRIDFAVRSFSQSDRGSQLDLEPEGNPSAFLDDFGEDPVKRARALSGAGVGQRESNVIIGEPRLPV